MKEKKSQITIVIPTRNRINSLNRLLNSISKQTYLPKEIIIVDSSDEKLNSNQLFFTQLDIKIIHSSPSVCLQRNIGIEQCKTEFIFLCDDDIEISENYIENLITYLDENPSVNMTSGLIYEKRNDEWKYSEKRIPFLKLIFNYIFGLSVWVDLKKEDYSKNKIIQKFIAFYLKKGNRIAKSGWPIVIDYKTPVFKTPIYGLGASVIRNTKIKFETAFYKNGIGDNYDFALKNNSEIYVVKNSLAYHHKDKTNRINNKKAYFYRVSALHFIMLKNKRFNFINLLYLLNSLNGNIIYSIFKLEKKLLLYNLKLIIGIIMNRNIYNKKN
ncbi:MULTISPECIES: glycosyltransferase family 2 protein [Flavobacterium]|uniref:Glycosyltransferase family 2 protein n=1 Tax=Flavobacterium jumunjinense TaxID=998845 RepID=A0ABV5GJL0_9FLAO|nr:MULTISPECIES: glycosyltransferase family 2 protein [Flavobacterium]